MKGSKGVVRIFSGENDMTKSDWTHNSEWDYILDEMRVRENLSQLPKTWRYLENGCCLDLGVPGSASTIDS